MKKILYRINAAFRVLISPHIIVYTMGQESENNHFFMITDDKLFVESAEDILQYEYSHNKKLT